MFAIGQYNSKNPTDEEFGAGKIVALVNSNDINLDMQFS